MLSTIVNLAFEVFGRSCEKSGFLYALVSNGDTKCASCVRWGVKELCLLYNTLLELLIIDVRYSSYTCLHMHCMLVARVVYSGIIIGTVL